MPPFLSREERALSKAAPTNSVSKELPLKMSLSLDMAGSITASRNGFIELVGSGAISKNSYGTVLTPGQLEACCRCVVGPCGT
jgi:hypothetical protein